MRIPLEISFRSVEKTDSIENLIWEKSAKLERFCDYINSCRVAIESPQQHRLVGQPFRVRINIRVPPRNELVVTKESTEGDIHDELSTILREAFAALEKQLKKLVEQQRGETKLHLEQETNAFVYKLFIEEDYGFPATSDGRDVYFHRNSVINNDFDRLAIGTGVHYVEEQGEKGPQASAVQVVDKPGVTPTTWMPRT
jgi:cold shock CspA family protein/ribosome-associated translation inhibitor RaiA